MRKFILSFMIVLAVLFIPFGLPFLRSEEDAVQTDEAMRAVWIAAVYNIDFPSRNNLTAAEMCAELDDIVQNTAAAGLNTIFFQVRPTADALYKSAIFPSSRWLVPEEGDELAIDPLAYLIQAAAEKNIGVHGSIHTRSPAARRTIRRLI